MNRNALFSLSFSPVYMFHTPLRKNIGFTNNLNKWNPFSHLFLDLNQKQPTSYFILLCFCKCLRNLEQSRYSKNVYISFWKFDSRCGEHWPPRLAVSAPSPLPFSYSSVYISYFLIWWCKSVRFALYSLLV